MSRIPNPFLGGGEMQPKPPQTPSRPGFLLITRPPQACTTWRGAHRGRSFPPSASPRHALSPPRHALSPPRHALSPPHPSDSFIPFSSTGINNNQDSSRRGRGGRFSQGTPRMYSPYHPSPRGGGGGERHMGSPGHNQGALFTPNRQNRDSYGNQRQNRFSFNGNSRGGRDNRGPISDIPVEKFVSPSMVKDPWAEFDVPPTATTVPTPDPLRRTATLPLLDDSEIIIDSDTSVVVETSYEGGGVSGTEGDSSPVPDTGSDSPYIATSSTSDKDMASDSTGED